LAQIDKERLFYERFIHIKEAYEVLQNPDSKKRYDNHIGNYVTPSPGASNYSNYTATERVEREAEFERIRQEIYRKAEQDKQEKHYQKLRAEEQSRWLESQKEHLRLQQRKQQQEMWKQMKDYTHKPAYSKPAVA
jgi:curved DNA-binding protein CbpA